MKSLNFLFITIDGGGNLPPMFGLANILADQGHKIRILSEPSMEKAITSQGFKFTPFKKLFQRIDRTEDIFKDWNAKGPNSPALDHVIFGTVKQVTEETIRAIKEEPTEILIVDCVLPTAVIAAEALNIPAVVVQHFPEYLPGPNRPPGVMGLLPGRGFFGNLRDRILSKVFNSMINKYVKPINNVRRQYELKPIKNTTELFFNSDLRVVTTLKSFDFPIEPLPDNFFYTGPIMNDPDWVEPWTNPWTVDDKRPLVVISLSTTYQNQASTIQSALNALDGMNVKGLVTLGPAIAEEKFSIPDNVVVVKSAPHSQIFPMADLVITHAGHGTIMRSLQHGLPLICLPMGRDQDDNAVKIDYHGCGLKLKPGSGSEEIKNAVYKILGDKRYKHNAEKFQQELMGYPVLHQISARIEKLVDSGKTGQVELIKPDKADILQTVSG